MSVRTHPGHIELTLTSSSSQARVRVRALSAALETRYAARPPFMSESWPAPLETLTIRGWELRWSSGRNASISLQGPNVLTSNLVCPVEVVVRSPDWIAVDASVVDQRVEFQDRSRSVPGPIDLVLIGDVELDGDDPLSLFDVVGIPGAGEHDEAVVGGELASDLGADPPTRPAD